MSYGEGVVNGWRESSETLVDSVSTALGREPASCQIKGWVNAVVVHGKFMFLSGEICLAFGPCRYGSRTEDQFKRAGITIEPYRGSGSASCGNARRDGTEGSRRYSKQTPTVIGGTQ